MSTSFNNTNKNGILANSAPTSPTYSSSPTHSMFATQQAQKTQKRFKSRFQKHLRKPPSFDTYLLRRTNSVSSVSSTSSYDSNTSTTSSNEDHTIVSPQAQVQTTSHVNHPSLTRRVSSAIRFPGLFDGQIPDDSSSVASTYSSSSDWDPRDDDNDEEEEEEFEFINLSRKGCHRLSFSSGCI